MTQVKLRVAVFFGGCSGEHEVSLRSAASVIEQLDRSCYEVVPIGIAKDGRWHQQEAPAPGTLLTVDVSAPLVDLPIYDRSSWKNIFDVAFPVLHGALYEDGVMQGLFETLGVPYVGAGVIGSSMGMDKDISKRLAHLAGVDVAPYRQFDFPCWEENFEAYEKIIADEIQYPAFVKPVNTGSSVGISKVKHKDQLRAAFKLAFEYDNKCLVEKAIPAREIEIAVLENPIYGEPALVSLPGEIIPTHEFYSYEAKYLDDKGAVFHLPARLDSVETKRVQNLAVKLFSALSCEGMARVDFFLDKETNHLYFNELNTIPGFTSISLYPKLWELSGRPYKQLLTDLVELALARHRRASRINRDFSGEHHED